MKTIIIIAPAILFVAFVIYFPSVFAQDGSNPTPLASNINSNYSQFGLQVLSESPNTLILSVAPQPGENAQAAADVIDLVKEHGYKIDAVTAFVYPGNVNQTEFPEIYTVFFSK